MKSYQYDAYYAPGSWKRLKLVTGGYSASFTCPKCGQICVLTHHEISDDGTVHPSLVCPTQGCDFHEHIKLEGWLSDSAQPVK